MEAAAGAAEMTDYPKERITFADMQKCCEREAQLRKRVYPKLIAEGKMKPEVAQHEFAMMQAAAAVFARLAKDVGERLL
jgi:hypothetical protein